MSNKTQLGIKDSDRVPLRLNEGKLGGGGGGGFYKVADVRVKLCDVIC